MERRSFLALNTDGAQITADIVTAAARIEREKNGKALTEDEARTLKAANFLRKIAPYMFNGTS